MAAITNSCFLVAIRSIRDVDNVWISTVRLLPSEEDLALTDSIRGFVTNPQSLVTPWVTKDLMAPVPAGNSVPHASILMAAGAASLGFSAPFLAVMRGAHPDRQDVLVAEILPSSTFSATRCAHVGTSDHLEVINFQDLAGSGLDSMCLSSSFGGDAMRRAITRLRRLGVMSEGDELSDHDLTAVASFLTGFVIVDDRLTWLFPSSATECLGPNGLFDVSLMDAADARRLQAKFANLLPTVLNKRVWPLMVASSTCLAPLVKDLARWSSVKHLDSDDKARWLQVRNLFAASDPYAAQTTVTA